MKVSLKWLNEYVDVPADTKALCDKLDLTGTGVEGVEVGGAGFSGVYTGQIVEKTAHPDSDHLWVTQVDVGDQNVDESGNPVPLQIVCGAQNFEAGDKVAVALVGAVLPGGFEIKKSKLRGQVSNGMNCSARELGLGDDHDGIMILDPGTPLGVDFAQYVGLSDRVLDLEITPNRPDCLSIEGMARELGAMYRIPVKDVCEGVELIEAGNPTADSVSVEIADSELCPRFTARVIRGVEVGPSPDWLAERVTASGARSINNVVDITNYVLYLLGQPLHAYDFDKVAGADGKAHIVVRAAREGEVLATLDGQERNLTPDMTLIATPESAIGLAGVMGGLDTEVSDQTTTILLEAATFSPGHTSRTSRNLGLFSEASMRSERQVDMQPIDRNIDFAAALIAQLCGGTVDVGLVDVWPVREQPMALQLRVARCAGMLGADIPQAEIEDILVRLGCDVKDAGDGVLDVVPPSFRPDLEREIDLYEEVLRLFGMENVPSTLPGGRERIGRRSWNEQVVARLHGTLRASGLSETQTYAFASPDDLANLRMDAVAEGEAVELINPLNAEQSVMRQSLIPNLLRSGAYNQNHGVGNIALYELGDVFHSAEGRKQPWEWAKLAGVLAGATDASWNLPSRAYDYVDGKGVVENIAGELGLTKLRFKALEANEAPFLQPGRGAQVLSGGAIVGWVGEVYPLAVAAFDAAPPVVAFELDVKALAKAASATRETSEISPYPAVSMDVAFVVDESVTHEKLMQTMQSAGGSLLASVQLFDVYRDQERLGEGKKSMAYALEYRAADHTLSGEEAEKAHSRLVKKVCGATKAEVRA
ncbi:MAG: phenylalanine--tRNA ligase subunit beta [Eggerthellaceae bacterium]|nr:phenylalanine--tRNA ligase subunit beta [Eggerthellaceae bacterium]